MAPKKIKNMEKFAEVIGISRPTVSKYFYDPSSVRETTRIKIEKALEQYDFSPNIFAMNQNRRLTKTIGVVVPYLADPFFAEIVRNIEWRCIDAGFWPILFSAHGRTDLENNALDTLRSLKPAGALLAPLGRSSDIEAMRKFTRDVPTVVFDSNLVVGETFVGSDNFQSLDVMVNYLCETGEPPCFLEMPPVNPNARKRRQAYTLAMEKLGHTPHVIRVGEQSWDFEKMGLTEGKRLIKEKKLPSETVLCSNDRLAIGFLAAAYQSGLRVGNGADCAMRVAGHDDHPWARFTCPALTTVAQNYDGIAEKSVEALFELLESGTTPGARTETFLDGTLIKRDSA